MSIAASVPARQSAPLWKSLFLQVVAGLALGVLLGVLAPGFAVQLKFFSDAFLKLISMIVAPIVFCVVVHGIAGAGDLKKVGRVGFKALVYFEVMTTVALAVGIAAGLRLRAGPRHEHRPVHARCQRAGQLRRQRAQAAGRRHRQLSSSTSSRPPRSTRWRATTCCRCCSSRSSSASSLSLVGETRGARHHILHRRRLHGAVQGDGPDRPPGAARRAGRRRLHRRPVRRRSSLEQLVSLVALFYVRRRVLRPRRARRGDAGCKRPQHPASSSPTCARS